MSQITYDFDKLLKQYPGFFKQLCDFVDKIREYDSLNETILAIGKKLQDAQAEACAYRLDIDARNVKLEEEHAAKIIQMNAVVAERERDMNARRRTLDQENEGRIQAAKDKADQILAEGTVAKAAVDQRVSDAQVTAVELESEIETRATILEGLKTKIAERQSDLDRIEASIAALRAKIA